MATLTPQAFAEKWAQAALWERASYVQYFLDLCSVLGQPAPAEIDLKGEFYTFEKGVEKSGPGAFGPSRRRFVRPRARRWGRQPVSIFPAPGSVVLHCDDTGELHGIEIYFGAGKRLGLDQIEFRRVPAGATEDDGKTEAQSSSLQRREPILPGFALELIHYSFRLPSLSTRRRLSVPGMRRRSTRSARSKNRMLSNSGFHTPTVMQ